MISTKHIQNTIRITNSYKLIPKTELSTNMIAIQQLITELKEEVVKKQTPMDRYEDWLKTAGLDVKKHQIQGMDFCIQREAARNPME